MIRSATVQDIPRMVQMGQHFRAQSSYSAFLADNPKRMAQLGEKLLQQGGILVAERDGEIIGMLGYILHDHFISGEKFAGEVFWWQEPSARGDGIKLLKEAEKQAKLAGAKYMQMIAPREQVATIYKRFGYDYVEETWQRAL